MSRNYLELPVGKALLWVTLFNATLVTGGTVFSSITFQSVQAQYREAQQHVRESQDKYQDAIALMKGVSREAEVIQARISRTVEVMSEEVKQHRDRHILIIAGEADDVVAEAVDARIRIENLEAQLDELAADSHRKLSAYSQQFQAEVLVEQGNLHVLRDDVQAVGEQSLVKIKQAEKSVHHAIKDTDRYLTTVKNNYLQLTKLNEKEMSDAMAIVDANRNQYLQEMSTSLKRLKDRVDDSYRDIDVVMTELEDARLALEAGQIMLEQAPAIGVSVDEKKPELE